MVRRDSTTVSEFVRAVLLVMVVLAPLFAVFWWLRLAPSGIERLEPGESGPPASVLGEVVPALQIGAAQELATPGECPPSAVPEAVVDSPTARQTARPVAEITWAEPDAARDAACHEATLSVLYDDSVENRARRDRICEIYPSGEPRSGE